MTEENNKEIEELKARVEVLEKAVNDMTIFGRSVVSFMNITNRTIMKLTAFMNKHDKKSIKPPQKKLQN